MTQTVLVGQLEVVDLLAGGDGGTGLARASASESPNPDEGGDGRGGQETGSSHVILRECEKAAASGILISGTAWYRNQTLMAIAEHGFRRLFKSFRHVNLSRGGDLSHTVFR